MDVPRLTEPGVKYFLGETLKHCQKKKFEYNSHFINVALVVIFVTLLGSVLIMSHRDKKTPDDIARENEEKQHYILGLARTMNERRVKETGTKITDLPEFESEFEITMKKFL